MSVMNPNIGEIIINPRDGERFVIQASRGGDGKHVPVRSVLELGETQFLGGWICLEASDIATWPIVGEWPTRKPWTFF